MTEVKLMCIEVLPSSGVYHTAILAFGREYHYFQDRGMVDYEVGKSGCGPPRDDHTKKLGWTEKTEEDMSLFIVQLRKQFNSQTYSLAENNCNHHSNRLCQFLLDKDLPFPIKEQEVCKCLEPYQKPSRVLAMGYKLFDFSVSPSNAPHQGAGTKENGPAAPVSKLSADTRAGCEKTELKPLMTEAGSSDGEPVSTGKDVLELGPNLSEIDLSETRGSTPSAGSHGPTPSGQSFPGSGPGLAVSCVSVNLVSPSGSQLLGAAVSGNTRV